MRGQCREAKKRQSVTNEGNGINSNMKEKCNEMKFCNNLKLLGMRARNCRRLRSRIYKCGRDAEKDELLATSEVNRCRKINPQNWEWTSR